MTNWLFHWKTALVGVIVLAACTTVAILLREGTAGNIASIVGLGVSVLGFVLTIWTVLEARGQIRQASDRAEMAIGQAQAEARRILQSIAGQLLAADCATLRNGVEDLRQAAQDGQWLRVIFRCQQCRPVAFRLAQDAHLTAEEASALKDKADNLQLILRFVERNRLSGQTGSLKESYLDSLDGLIAFLALLQGRFHHESLRLPRTQGE